MIEDLIGLNGGSDNEELELHDTTDEDQEEADPGEENGEEDNVAEDETMEGIMPKAPGRSTTDSVEYRQLKRLAERRGVTERRLKSRLIEEAEKQMAGLVFAGTSDHQRSNLIESIASQLNAFVSIDTIHTEHLLDGSLT